jgi:hypothetical protein
VKDLLDLIRLRSFSSVLVVSHRRLEDCRAVETFVSLGRLICADRGIGRYSHIWQDFSRCAIEIYDPRLPEQLLGRLRLRSGTLDTCFAPGRIYVEQSMHRFSIRCNRLLHATVLFNLAWCLPEGLCKSVWGNRVFWSSDMKEAFGRAVGGLNVVGSKYPRRKSDTQLVWRVHASHA